VPGQPTQTVVVAGVASGAGSTRLPTREPLIKSDIADPS
jgi:hypothetical protein